MLYVVLGLLAAAAAAAAAFACSLRGHDDDDDEQMAYREPQCPFLLLFFLSPPPRLMTGSERRQPDLELTYALMPGIGHTVFASLGQHASPFRDEAGGSVKSRPSVKMSPIYQRLLFATDCLYRSTSSLGPVSFFRVSPSPIPAPLCFHFQKSGGSS